MDFRVVLRNERLNEIALIQAGFVADVGFGLDK